VARYLSQVAVTRLGPRGAPTEVGNLSIQTARVTHLTSREGDGQFHIHLMAMSKRAAQVATNRDPAEAGWRGQVPRSTALPAHHHRLGPGRPGLRTAGPSRIIPRALRR